ncbi:Hpt domain-containing protein [Thalassotalea montiporae]
MNQPATIDKSLIQGYLDNLGGTVVAQMLALYQKQSGVYIGEIEAAISEQSQSNWQERCHKMKGAAASVGLLSVHQFLVAIEKSTETWPQKSEHLARLKIDNNAAIADFKQWLESL